MTEQLGIQRSISSQPGMLVQTLQTSDMVVINDNTQGTAPWFMTTSAAEVTGHFLTPQNVMLQTINTMRGWLDQWASVNYAGGQ